MKEAIFIIFVVFLLAALTAVRYRKQIAGMIGIARMLKETKRAVTQRGTKNIAAEPVGIPLVNCSKCGVWVPRTKAIKMRDVYYCSESCLAASAN